MFSGLSSSSFALAASALEWSGEYVRTNQNEGEGGLFLAIDPVTRLIRGFMRGVPSSGTDSDSDEARELLGVWHPPNASRPSEIVMASGSADPPSLPPHELWRLTLLHHSDASDNRSFLGESDKTAYLTDMNKTRSTRRKWVREWNGEMPPDLIRLSDAAREEVYAKQKAELNPPPVVIDPTRKVLRVTAGTRRKPRINTSTAAQHANVTSLALVFRMLSVREVTRASHACKLWQSAALNPLAYLCTYTTSTPDTIVKYDGSQLSVVAPSDDMLKSRIVRQYRAVAFTDSPHKGNSAVILSGFQQMQLLTLTLGTEERPLFRSIPPSLKLLVLKLDYWSTNMLPKDFAQQIAHLHQLVDLVVVMPSQQLSGRDLHQLWLASETMPSFAGLHLRAAAQWDGFDRLRLKQQGQPEPPQVEREHKENEDSSSSDEEEIIPPQRTDSIDSWCDLGPEGRPPPSNLLITRLLCVSIPVLVDHPCRLTSVLEMMPNLVSLQLRGTNSFSWPTQVSGFPLWSQTARSTIKEIVIAGIDQPNAVCRLIASAKLERVLHLVLIIRTARSSSPAIIPLTNESLTMLCESVPQLKTLRMELGPMEVTTFDMFASLPELYLLADVTWPRAISRGNLAKAFPALTRLIVAGDPVHRSMPYEALLTIPLLKVVRWVTAYHIDPEAMRKHLETDNNERKANKRIVDDKCTLTMEDRKLAAIQASYICYTCSTEDGPQSLVCEGCAATCHIGHIIGPKEMPHNPTFVCACSVLGDEHHACKFSDVSSVAGPTSSMAETKRAQFAGLCATAAEREKQRLEQEQDEAAKLAKSKAATVAAATAKARYFGAALELTSPTYLAYPPTADDAIMTCTISPPPIDVLPTSLLARVFSCLNLPELVCVNRVSSGWQRALADPLAIASDLEHPSIDRSKNEDGRPRQLARLTLDRVYGLHVQAPVFVVTSARQLDLGLASSSLPRSLFSRVHHFVLRPSASGSSLEVDKEFSSMLLMTSRRLEQPVYSVQIDTPTMTHSTWNHMALDTDKNAWPHLRFLHVHASLFAIHSTLSFIPAGVEHWQYTIAPAEQVAPFPFGLATRLATCASLHTVCVRTMSRMVLPPTCWTASHVDFQYGSRVCDFLGQLASLAPQVQHTHWLVPVDLADIDRYIRPRLHAMDPNGSAADPSDSEPESEEQSADSTKVATATKVPTAPTVTTVVPSRVRSLIVRDYRLQALLVDALFPELESLVIQSTEFTQLVDPMQLNKLLRLEMQQTGQSVARLVRILSLAQLIRLEHLVLCDPDTLHHGSIILSAPQTEDLDEMFKAMPALTHLALVNIRCSDLSSFAHLPRLRVLEHFRWPLLHSAESELDLASIFPSLERLHVAFGSTSDPSANIADAIQRLPKLRAVRWMANKEVPPSMLSRNVPSSRSPASPTAFSPASPSRPQISPPHTTFMLPNSAVDPIANFSVVDAFIALVLGAREERAPAGGAPSLSSPGASVSAIVAPATTPFIFSPSSGSPFSFGPTTK